MCVYKYINTCIFVYKYIYIQNAVLILQTRAGFEKPIYKYMHICI
jgi:hypothetical protein